MAATAPKTAVNVVFGAMTFGPKGGAQSSVHDLDKAKAIIDIFQNHGHNEIDTASQYSMNGSEAMLADLDWQKRGLVMATKFYPRYLYMSPPEDKNPIHHLSPEGIRHDLITSFEALKTDTVDLWYLHGPDRTVPLEVTLKAVNDLYKEGKFKRFGVSNFMSWEVAAMCELCRANGWKQPDVYQGVYNALHRAVEPELFPCLRKYGMAFYNFNPLAGGYLTSRYQTKDQTVEAGTRFDPEKWQGKAYRARYWNDQYFQALEVLRPVAKKHGLTEAECALRWMQHHSQLKREYGDAVIIGASSVENLIDFEKGPLPEDVLATLDEGWNICRAVSWKYWH